MKKRFKIGLPFWKIGENSFGSTLSYVDFISKFGEIVPLMPDHEIVEDLDLLVIPGGADINPAMYGRRPGLFTQKPDIYKDYFDAMYLPKYVEMNVPVFGICRGAQAINVLFDGILIQDMYHETNKAEDPYSGVHKIIFTSEADSLKIPNLKGKTLNVNSRHHQAISKKFLNKDLAVIATHEDGTVEMIAHRTKPIVGVQFHPEDCNEKNCNLFVATVINMLLTEKQSIMQ